MYCFDAATGSLLWKQQVAAASPPEGTKLKISKDTGYAAPSEFLQHLTVFVLACFVGWQVVWNVTPALHTPLMSVTNAISSIIIVGALLQISSPEPWILWLAGIAVLITSINIIGGFAVTQRMLQMFRK